MSAVLRLKLRNASRRVRRILRRDFTDPHLLVISAALIVAVASVGSVDTFTDRVRRALVQQSSALLGADLAIVGRSPLSPRYQDLASTHGLATSYLAAMRSVVTTDDEQLQLVELKAAAPGYPLRGELITSFGRDPQVTTTIPAPGQVWVEKRLLDMLSLGIGDRITIGEFDATIERILLIEPDRAGSLFNLAPRVLMNYANLEQTKLVLEGSRLQYTFLVAGAEAQLEDFRRSLELSEGDELRTPDQARPEIRAAIDRAEQFLSLATLSAIVLAGIAMALAAQGFAIRNAQTVALLRVMGATKKQVREYFVTEIAVLACVSTAIGLALGLLGQQVLAVTISGWVQSDLPAARLIGASRAVFVGIIALLGFALPFLLDLPKISPALLLRQPATRKHMSKRTLFFFAATALLLVMPWRAGDVQMTAFVAFGILASLVILGGLSAAIISLLYRFRYRLAYRWRFAIVKLSRRGLLTTTQISALGLGITALFVLALIRSQLLDNWLENLPPDAPNQFLINIQPNEVDALEEFFVAHQLSRPAIYPMTRGRLVAINDTEIELDQFDDPRARRLVAREFNLSSSSALKPDNKIVAGEFWRPNTSAPEFSIEQGIAETLGIGLFDELHYNVADQRLSGVVTSVRSVQWETMRVNFFVEGTPSLLRGYPATYITSFHLDDNSSGILSELVKTFPSVTAIDITALVQQIRVIMTRSSYAIDFVFIFTVVAGLLVLIASTQITQTERIFTTALCKTLGAKQTTLFIIMGFEFAVIGIIAGSIAAIAAQVCAWLIASQVLGLPFAFEPGLIPLGAFSGMAMVLVVGLSAVWLAYQRPSAALFRYG